MADAIEQMKQLLAGCQNPATREAAEAKLNALRQENLGTLLGLLAQFLRAEQGDAASVPLRQQAGLYIKMCISGRTEETQLAASGAWLRIPPPIRAQIKPILLETLSSAQGAARSTAANVIAALGTIELTVAALVGGGLEGDGNPAALSAAGGAECKAALATGSPGLWPELLPTLLANVTQAASNEVKHASLECLGYLCQNLKDEPGVFELPEPTEAEDPGQEGDVLTAPGLGGRGLSQEQTNQVLTAIVDGMRADRDERIRLVATHALLNSITFLHKNFGVKAERDVIMQVLCEATQCRSAACGEQVRVTAYQTINEIAYFYYEHIGGYMQVGSMRERERDDGVGCARSCCCCC